MNHPSPELPNAEALCLYQRLLARDPTARADFAVAVFEPLRAWLQATNRDVDPDLYAEAAATAVLNFGENPQAYDPARLNVIAYLRMAASGDLKNLLRKERRHQRRRRPWNVVENAADAGKYLGRDDDPSLPLQIAEARQSTAAMRAVLEKLTDVERRVWELMRQGERHSSAYAEVMGVAQLPKEEKEEAIQRVKDRVGKRMKRAEKKHGRSS